MMTHDIDVDYLVVGAGAAGMAFTDEILAHTAATVAIVDRRHAPGGHWLDAYPFVRLHQPSAFYGVTSEPLGADAIDLHGVNAGYYELAGPDELRAYYERVMHRRFVPTGRVRWFPSCEYDGDTGFTSRLSGDTWRVRVKKKIVDARYIEGAIPATSPPPFDVADGVRCVPVGALASLPDRPDRFVIIGAGKTALDACGWLLEQGVSPSSIRWIKPREAWWLNRKFQQPLALVTDLYRGVAMQLEAMAQASSVDDLFARLEEANVFVRVDRSVTPTMFRGGIISDAEVERLRAIEDVVRKGHVRRIERDAIVLDDGTVPTDVRTLHVHCAANALARPPLRPIFEPGRVTFQPFMWGFVCYQAAMIAVIEAAVDDDDEKNRMVHPISFWEAPADFASVFLATMLGDQERAPNAKLRAWMKKTRLNPAGAISAMRDDPRVKETRARIDQAAIPAALNLQNILGLRRD